MARFVDLENDDAIINFENMSVRQFRYLVRKAIEMNEIKDDEKRTKEIGEFNGFDF